MSRSADERPADRVAGGLGFARRPPARAGTARRPRILRIVLTVPWLGLLAAGAAGAQGVPATPAPELTPRVQESLRGLQEGWLQWTVALYGGEPERARGVVEELAAEAERLGMARLPDLSAGALVQAVEAAREGDADRAALALEAAERLDPGRPETAFAAAKVARLAGRWASAVWQEVRALARLPNLGLEWQLVLHDLVLWLLASLLLGAALFVALQMGVRGPALFRDLTRFLERRGSLPRVAALALTWVLVLWPLALPSGLLWLCLYWSLLLWGYLGGRERVVVAFGWLLLAATPVMIEQARERIALALSPPVRALDSVAGGRLYGGLFTDLGVLAGALPNAPAVEHVLADLNVRLGQWDEARLGYEAVLDDEPDNVAALVNLGAYYYLREEYGNAVALFRKAAALAAEEATVGAAAHFDLSLAYGASYLFDDSGEALAEARRIDDRRVVRWMRRPDRQRLVTVEGGIDRIPEIERALRRLWSAPAEGPPALDLMRRARSALLVVLLAAVAVGFHGITGRGRRAAGAAAAVRSARGRWPPALFPGLPSAAQGSGLRAYVALLTVAGPLLVLVAAAGGLGYPVPWRYDPGGWLVPALAILALALTLGTRMLRAVRGS